MYCKHHGAQGRNRDVKDIRSVRAQSLPSNIHKRSRCKNLNGKAKRLLDKALILADGASAGDLVASTRLEKERNNQ